MDLINYNVINEINTLKKLIDSNYSLTRFGDGELRLADCRGTNLSFQKNSDRLHIKLREILKNKNKNILVGIPNIYINNEIDNIDNIISERNKNFWKAHKKRYKTVLDINKEYYSSFVSRPSYIKGIYNKEYFELFKKITENKEIVIVTNADNIKKNVKLKLYLNADKIDFVKGPQYNAFDEYDTILENCLKYPKNKLFICLLGPTATVLAYDLALLGYQALDLGRMSNEFLKLK